MLILSENRKNCVNVDKCSNFVLSIEEDTSMSCNLTLKYESSPYAYCLVVGKTIEECTRLMNLLYAKMVDNSSYIDMYELCKDIKG